MKQYPIIALICLAIALLSSCQNAGQSTTPNTAVSSSVTVSDSLALSTLIKNIYSWHQHDTAGVEFVYKADKPTDTVYSGIDWPAHEARLQALEKTNFFSQQFINNHKLLALRIEKDMKQAGPERCTIGDLLDFEPEADLFCNCQDMPDNYEKAITLADFTINADTANFTWSWGNTRGFEPNKYAVTAIKENGHWKVSYLEGFDKKGFGVE